MKFPENLPEGWRTRLAPEKDKAYFKKLVQFLNQEKKDGQTIFPDSKNTLRALQMVDLNAVKVVILGQDPYHGPGQAVGLCFAVANEVFPKPPSLQNIFKEIKSDLGVEIPKHASDLTGWAAQGVLLLNTVLSVRANQALSHRDQGWEHFTDEVIRALNEREAPIVFLLWGSHAQKKQELLTNKNHICLRAPHPSPLSASRGFLGCKHFSKANAILTDRFKLAPVNWGQTSLSVGADTPTGLTQREDGGSIARTGAV